MERLKTTSSTSPARLRVGELVTHRGKTWKVVYVSDNRALILEGGKSDLEDGLSISPFSDLPRVKENEGDVSDPGAACEASPDSGEAVEGLAT